MEFGAKLKEYRERAGLSQNALARASGLNPAFINRLESGERSPSNRTLVEQICDALSLEGPERDDLLGVAGHLPDVYARVSPSDPTLLLVAEVLGDQSLSAEDREQFRQVLRTLALRWRQVPGGGP